MMISLVKEQKFGETKHLHVFKTRDTETNQNLVVKTREDFSEARKEARILSKLDHPNIIELVNFIELNKSCWLVRNYYWKDLQSYIHKMPYQPQLIRSYAFKILCGLSHCNSNGVLHRNINPSNILLHEKGSIRIIGFGSSTFVSEAEENVDYTTDIHYKAPEVLLGAQQCSFASDIWSAGVVIAEMFKGGVLFNEYSEMNQIKMIFRTLGTPTEEDWSGVTSFPKYPSNFPVFPKAGIKEIEDPNARDLVMRMLTYDPSKRIAVSEALYHPYFKDLQQKVVEKCRV